MDLPSILIPAYKPDDKMINLIKALHELGFHQIIVVNDGSDAGFDPVFAEAASLDCLVLKHAINMGKGRAMKTGFNEAMNRGLAAEGVITADADGQHAPADIMKIALAMRAAPEALVLGVRRFTGKVPLKSRFGNGITRIVFSLINGGNILDTQTGLRGIPAVHLPLILALTGERYEYEMNMLLAARPNDINMVQVPIDTIYIEGNRSSHFKVVRDSARIYALLFKFLFSSAMAGIVDYGLFVLMTVSFPGQLLASVVTARAVSSLINFLINRNLVFKQKGAAGSAACRYYTLAAAVMLSGYGLIKLLSGPLGVNVYLAKVMADILMYFVSFLVQREFVYKVSRRPAAGRKT